MDFLARLANDIIFDYKRYHWYYKNEKCTAFVVCTDAETEGIQAGDKFTKGCLTLLVQPHKNDASLVNVAAIVDLKHTGEDEAIILNRMLNQDVEQYMKILNEYALPATIGHVNISGFWCDIPAHAFIVALELMEREEEEEFRKVEMRNGYF